jgi:hypothetical protein
MLDMERGWDDIRGFWEMKRVVVVTARVESIARRAGNEK